MAREAVALNAAQEYWIDAWQRAVLCLDALNQRGKHSSGRGGRAEAARAELCRRGRARRTHARAAGQLRPCPHRSAGGRDDRSRQAADRRGRPPRGSRARNRRHETGERDRRGAPRRPRGLFHRLPAEAVKGQTIEDVSRAEAIFIETVAARHREAEGKPIVIANCQAGWPTTIAEQIGPRVTLTDFAACGGFEGHDRVL